MNIGFDLDKIFIDYPPFIPKKAIDWLYLHSIKDLFKKRQQSQLSYHIPKNKYARMIRRLSHNFLFRPPIKKNINLLNQLNQNYPQLKMYLISSRYLFLEKITLHILKRYKILSYFEKIFLNTEDEQPHLFKEKIIKKFKIELYIDDDLKLLKHLKNNCPETTLLWYSPGSSQTSIDSIKIISDLQNIKGYIASSEAAAPIRSKFAEAAAQEKTNND